jgi:SAM-dependent methyltransferase
MVASMGPKEGDIVLELAAGTGETGFAAAVRVGLQGKLISTDFAPAMVDAARRRGDELGLSNVEYRVMDAERIDLDDDSVDGVLCRWGYMLLADPAAALSETRRVLREGGKVAFSVWGAPERNQWASVPGKVLVERGHLPAPEAGAPGIFAMADEQRIRELVGDAGFTSVEIGEVPMSWTYEDSDDYWRFLTELAGALAMAINGLPEEEQRAIRDQVEERLAEQLSEMGFELDALCHNVVAS